MYTVHRLHTRHSITHVHRLTLGAEENALRSAIPKKATALQESYSWSYS